MKKILSFHKLTEHVSLFLTVIQLSIIFFVFIPPINAQTKLITISGSNDWTDLIAFLPNAKMTGISVGVSLLPPSQTPPICPTCNYSEPYRLDFMRWAKEIANLSLRYSNLTGYAIGDLQSNLNLGYIKQTTIDSMITASKSINPRLQFITTLPNIYYVDQKATGNGSGLSWANASKTVSGLPWKSINGGDTVYVSGGTDSTVYMQTGTSLINTIPAFWKSGNPIVITKGWESGHNGDVYFAQNAIRTSTGNNASFYLSGCHNLKFTNLRFDVIMSGADPGTDDNTAIFLYQCSNIIFDNCIIRSDGSGNGIWFDHTDSLTVNNCSITVSANSYTLNQDCIHAGYGHGGHTFTNNTLHNYGGASGVPHNDGIQIGYGGSTSVLTTVIANNFIYMNLGTPVSEGAGCIFISGSYGDRYLIYNNVLVMNNITSYDGILFSRQLTSPKSHLIMKIFNNTIVNGYTTANPIENYYTPNSNCGGLDSLFIENNMIANTGGAQCYMAFSHFADSVSYAKIDYNHYWSRNRLGEPYITTRYSTTALRWGPWKNTYNQDANSDTNAVNFVNYSSNDASGYALQLGSPGIDAGTDLTGIIPAVGINGVARTTTNGNKWDIGAFEVKN